MFRKAIAARRLTFALALTSSAVAQAADAIKFIAEPAQRIDARYRLFRTENVWNFLELDTAQGKVWQVQFTITNDSNRTRIPINSTVLAMDGKPGRFTLYPTSNNWNFILVDQDLGRVWQVQFSVSDENRGIFSIPIPE